MLYTSYLSKLNKLSDDSVKILIMQWKGKLDLSKYNLIWKPELSPIGLSDFKNNIETKEKVFLDFKEQLKREPSLTAINEIIDMLKEGKDVYLICCEKQLCDCHRRIVAQHISEIANIEWKEYREE